MNSPACDKSGRFFACIRYFYVQIFAICIPIVYICASASAFNCTMRN